MAGGILEQSVGSQDHSQKVAPPHPHHPGIPWLESLRLQGRRIGQGSGGRPWEVGACSASLVGTGLGHAWSCGDLHHFYHHHPYLGGGLLPTAGHLSGPVGFARYTKREQADEGHVLAET